MKHCTTDKCPQILDSSCVFYEGASLIFSGINTNDSVETVIQKLNLKLESFPIFNLNNYYNKTDINNIIKEYIPLSGTLPNYPIVGNIEFSPGDNVKLYSNDSSIMIDDGYLNINSIYTLISSINNNSFINVSPSEIFLYAGTINNSKYINLSTDLNYISIESNVTGAGLVGKNYYGNNYVDNSFVQKKFVIDTFNSIDLSNYYTKTETYSQTQIDNIVSDLELEIDNKVNSSDVYLKTQTYSQTEINGFLSNKQNLIGYTPENLSNKSDSYTASSSTTYASTKALVDGLANKLEKGTYTGTAQDLKNSIDGKENISNKQNDLNADATNTKYPTVTAVNSGLADKQKKLSSFDESILIEPDGNIEGNVSLFTEYFNQQVCELNFIPTQIIGVYQDGIKLLPKEFNITLPKTITIKTYSTEKIEIQYTHLKS